jgi:protein transport protein SEC24
VNSEGKRIDADTKPEYSKGVYEFKAPTSFETGKWKQITFMIVIDVSYNSVQIGFLQQILASIKNSLDYFPMPKNTNLGFITYNSSIHFYSWQSPASSDPTILYVNDCKSPFIPYPISKLVFNLANERNIIDSILNKIQTLYDISKVKPLSGGYCGGAALNSAITALKEIGGKAMVFSYELFNNGFGSLPNRDNPTLYSTDKEKSLKMPVPFYVDLSASCVKDKIAVDIFACNPSSMDFASLAALCSLTGGEAYHYQNFNNLQGEKLYYDLFRNLTRNYGFDTAFTVRSSIGLRPSEYYGGFFTKTDKIVELSSIDSDKSIGVTLKIDGKLIPDTDAYVQFALLYTHMSGERRIRIINNVLSVTPSQQSLYSYIDGEATLNLMVKESIINLLKANIADIKEKLVNQMCHMLWYYRVFVSQSAQSSQLVLPESLKFFPLFLLGLFKLQIFMNLKEVKLDHSISQLHYMLSCHLPAFIKRLYPKLYPIVNVTDPKSYCDGGDEVNMKPQNICTIKEKLQKNEAYIMDNGEYIYLYVGQEIPPEFCQQVIPLLDFGHIRRLCTQDLYCRHYP